MTESEKKVLLERLEKAIQRYETNIKDKEPIIWVLHDIVQDLTILRKMVKENNYSLITF